MYEELINRLRDEQVNFHVTGCSKSSLLHEAADAIEELSSIVEVDPNLPEIKRHEQPQTNADRIRQMTDEELAEWILREPTIGYFAVCPPGTKAGEDCPTSPCEQCWLDWLKSPVEEG